jgi:hypothetical protein
MSEKEEKEEDEEGKIKKGGWIDGWMDGKKVVKKR